MFESLDLGTITTIVLGLVATFAGGFWLKAKGKISKVVKLANLAIGLLTDLSNALEDDKVTKEEIAALKAKAAQVKAAWQDLVKKSE